MSTATEISRLITARNKIRDKMVELGLGFSTDKMDALADEVDSIVNRGSVSATVQEGDTYTIPAGYHNGSGTVSGVSGGGNYNLQSKSVTPTKSQQSVTPDNGYYGLSDVTVAAIPAAYQNVTSVTATASDVLANKIIVESNGTVTAGTMTNNGAVNKTLDTTNGNQSYTVPTGYHNGSGSVSITLESKNATPSETAQTITPTSGKVLSQVSIGAISSNYVGSNIAQHSAADLTVSGAIVTAPAGYYAATASKTIASGTATTPATSITANPAITVSANGLITATTSASKSITPTISAGYITAGTAGTATVSGSTTSQLDTQAATTVTPSTTQQTVGGAGKFMTGAITVSAIPSKYGDVSNDTAKASHILYGYKAHSANASGNAIQITGSMPYMNTYYADILDFDGEIDQLDDTAGASADFIWYLPSAYYENSRATIIVTTKVATPTTTSQIITADAVPSNCFIGKMIINPIPSNFGDTSTDTAVASQLLSGYKAHTKSGSSAVQITGTMPNNGAISASFDGLTTLSYTVSSGYTSGGTVSLTSDIENALAAI